MRHAVVVVFAACQVGALLVSTPAPRRLRRLEPRMCICVNCALVDRCKAYHVIEEKHRQPHLAENPDFQPTNPTVAVIWHKGEQEAELDVQACDSFQEERGRWLKMMPRGTLLSAGFDPDYVPT
mmetsp:Transcript_9060/g.27805  ORF Transcript_9060/g.27805 Transcript_9060/m.27805 type:complete len:124 (+) Transcript_9060:19-390(+)